MDLANTPPITFDSVEEAVAALEPRTGDSDHEYGRRAVRASEWLTEAYGKDARLPGLAPDLRAQCVAATRRVVGELSGYTVSLPVEDGEGYWVPAPEEWEEDEEIALYHAQLEGFLRQLETLH